MEEKLAKFRQNRKKQHHSSIFNGASVQDAISPLKRLFTGGASGSAVEEEKNCHTTISNNHDDDEQQDSSQPKADISETDVAAELQHSSTIWLIRSIKLLTWCLVAYVLSCYELAGPFLLVSAAAALLYYGTSSRARKKTELSAYSVFNPNCVRIEGTLTAEQFENEILRRPLDNTKRS